MLRSRAVILSRANQPPPSMAGEILRVPKEGIEMEEEEEESMNGKGKDGIVLSSLTDGTSVAKNSSISSTIESGFEWVEQLCGLTPTSRQGQLVYMGVIQLDKVGQLMRNIQ